MVHFNLHISIWQECKLKIPRSMIHRTVTIRTILSLLHQLGTGIEGE